MKNNFIMLKIIRFTKVTLLVFLLSTLFTGALMSCVPLHMSFSATLDGKPWTGPIDFDVYKGNESYYHGSAVNASVDPTRGNNLIRYNSGGPVEAILLGISARMRQGAADNTEFAPGNNIAQSIGVSYSYNEPNPDVYYDYTFAFVTTVTVSVDATLDGSPWFGPVSYTINGAQTVSGIAAPQTFEKMSKGSYTLAYQSGGPAGATLKDITPPNISLTPTQSGTFVLNFINVAANIDLEVAATLDGNPWSGSINYNIEGAPGQATGTIVPNLYNNVAPGNYTVKYNYGGPLGSRLLDITCVESKSTSGVNKTTLFINFESLPKLNVQATLDGQPWKGDITCDLTWQQRIWDEGEYISTVQGLRILHVFWSTTDVVEGSQYWLSYISRGPAHAAFARISPDVGQVASAGDTTFTVEFISKGTITVKGLVSNTEWSGPCVYTLHCPEPLSGGEPVTISGTTLPQTFYEVPEGEYTISYISGGPEDMFYYPNEPETKTLLAGQTLCYNMNFVPRWFQLISLPVAFGADLSLTATADDYNPGGADYINYFITVTNSGPFTATGIQVKFLLAGVTYTSDTPDQGTYNNATGIWDVGSIAPGTSVTLTVYVGMSGAPPGSVITNTAEVIASEVADPDSVPNNTNPAEDDQASVTITISIEAV